MNKNKSKDFTKEKQEEDKQDKGKKTDEIPKKSLNYKKKNKKKKHVNLTYPDDYVVVNYDD